MSMHNVNRRQSCPLNFTSICVWDMKAYNQHQNNLVLTLPSLIITLQCGCILVSSVPSCLSWFSWFCLWTLLILGTVPGLKTWKRLVLRYGRHCFSSSRSWCIALLWQELCAFTSTLPMESRVQQRVNATQTSSLSALIWSFVLLPQFWQFILKFRNISPDLVGTSRRGIILNKNCKSATRYDHSTMHNGYTLI